MWSTSRRPGCGTLIFHLLSGCPALVVPVTSSAPLLAWSPWTLSQMRTYQAAAQGVKMNDSGYSPEVQHEQICEYLDAIISLAHMSPVVREKYEGVLARSVSLVINGALATERCGNVAGIGRVDAERAGVVMFRY